MSVWKTLVGYPRDQFNLGALVLRSSYEVSPVGCHLDVCDLATDFVCLYVLDKLSVLNPANPSAITFQS